MGAEANLNLDWVTAFPPSIGQISLVESAAIMRSWAQRMLIYVSVFVEWTNTSSDL